MTPDITTNHDDHPSPLTLHTPASDDRARRFDHLADVEDTGYGDGWPTFERGPHVRR